MKLLNKEIKDDVRTKAWKEVYNKTWTRAWTKVLNKTWNAVVNDACESLDPMI